MKLGLLVVLAVAVLVPSLSEGRTVSNCELKEKLGEAITLPEKLQKYKEKILALVICNVKRKSRLNTSLVKVLGMRRPTTTARPTMAVTTISTPRVNEMTSETTTTEGTTTQPTTTETTTTEGTTTQPTTTERTTTEGTTTQPTTTETTTTQPTSPVTNQTASAPLESDATNSTLEPNRTAPVVRGKREADTSSEEANTSSKEGDTSSEEANTTSKEGDASSEEADTSSEEADTSEMDRSLEEMLTKEESKFDEEELQQDDDRMDDEDEESDEGDEDEQELEESGKRKKRSWGRWKPKRKRRPVVPWSLGYYGLFQLSDSHFCDSGYRWSRNKCRTSCTAFTDDNIMDDIECFVKSGYWRYFLWGAPRRCVRNVFAKCE